jgi:hypothetical protein
VGRSFGTLCCSLQATLIQFCLTDTDLACIGIEDAPAFGHGLSPASRRRSALFHGCQKDPALARCVTDRLDLAFLDTILLVRAMAPEALRSMVAMWATRPEGQALPGLLWALCSDERDDVHRLGTGLAHEAVGLASRTFVAAASAVP